MTAGINDNFRVTMLIERGNAINTKGVGTLPEAKKMKEDLQKFFPTEKFSIMGMVGREWHKLSEEM